MSEATDRMKRGQQLYDARTKLWRRSCEIPLRDLERLNAVLEYMSPEDFKAAASFIEGLAQWNGYRPEDHGG